MDCNIDDLISKNYSWKDCLERMEVSVGYAQKICGLYKKEKGKLSMAAKEHEDAILCYREDLMKLANKPFRSNVRYKAYEYVLRAENQTAMLWNVASLDLQK